MDVYKVSDNKQNNIYILLLHKTTELIMNKVVYIWIEHSPFA